MGKHDQKRLIRKIDLERFLSTVQVNLEPKVNLEQYTTSEHIAATMLYIAAYTNNDITCKRVLDLGCGTGRLGLGAAFLGAETVLGIDVDRDVLKIAKVNTQKTNLSSKIDWVNGDISVVNGCFDTVLQNPPFGVQSRNADRAFLVKALASGKMIYSLHNHPIVDKRLISMLKSSGVGGLFEVQPSVFLKRFIEQHGGVIRAVYATLMSIPKMFGFHTKVRHDFVIDLYVIERKIIK
ncbi:MAG: METTL5 family protein [Candidatus Bathyarchaeota archaeon]|uniref:METTL5 family protein n=1 Tax=Candidatus Bathycorpusculum sp. TaxID=2994959 RepID=UPI00281E4B7D|nr:METTL5 family protein [Candidatus Termiticorpusculum sp.]MCL2256692.1 METTL5 family protein [Candidatus Termiticorpusculum sp.]MCL2293124.1 METTL5 family protein [Candidatus Termiticorpusculum sp.]